MELLVGSACLLVPIALVAGVMLLVASSARSRQHRTVALVTHAARREWRYLPSWPGLEARFRGEPFDRGRRRTVTNVVDGWYEGRAFLAFDYSFVSGSGRADTTYYRSVVTMHLGCTAPMLQVAPQGAIGRFLTDLLGHDLVLGDPVFDQAFNVRTEAEDFAHDVLHPDLRAMLVAQQDRAWRIEGDSLVMFRTGHHTPEEIDVVLASMKALLDRVPEPVWQRLRGEGPHPGSAAGQL